MRCLIITPKYREEYRNIQSVILPAFFGELQILPDHAESFVLLKQGKIILEGKKNKEIFIEKGVCHMRDNTVSIVL